VLAADEGVADIWQIARAPSTPSVERRRARIFGGDARGGADTIQEVAQRLAPLPL